MSKTIDQRVKELKSKEERLKLALSDNGDDLKEKAKRVGKIALVSGLVALAGYLIYKAFFEEEEEDKPSGKKKKRHKPSHQSSYGLTQRLSAYAMPYITKFLVDYFSPDSEKETKED